MGGTSSRRRKGAIKATEETRKRSEITSALLQARKEPFADLLATIVGAAPSEQELRTWAAGDPGKWGTLVSTFAKLIGYAERRDHLHTHTHFDFSSMSDAELQQHLRSQIAQTPQLANQLKDITDAEYTLLESGSDTPDWTTAGSGRPSADD